MNLHEILKKIENLSPLPETIVEIEKYKRKDEKEIDELNEIINKDALLVTTILKIANSAMFGFRSKVETPKRAISLLGINFVISVAISTASQRIIISSLSAYGLSNDDFKNSSSLSLALTSLWLNKLDPELKDSLLLATLLQDIGKFIISDVLISNDKAKDFLKKLEDRSITIEEIEKDFFGFSSSYITAQIFKHWNLSSNLINSIEFIDNPKIAPEDYKKKSMILDVIKTATDIRNPLSQGSINKAIDKAKEYNLNYKSLEEAIKKLKNRIEK
ncbi:HDOD domain protein [Aliarcobacter thereius]|uniref:HDOD domain protein n=2 Tax=Aliarcobacter thereius TaxID=544718 RepID=A0A1C0B635_9BACT|nr:HDOD domain-containing protein [Aliarcobacter thereius]OCL86305.1 HDOD domain protein [Aliarcobacter thereius]OCL89989.1 HDOD domain protein [Aliarcobacter thereius]OCL96411.1 iron-regulated outer membrane protein IrgA [Aliarcobacter thereius LMG 24486]OCL98628.1 HDOD domain protein [Aliarcobacter thereius]QBF15628.1 HDOD domain-containing protein [Aliarcobacter thereius LMG 24486]